MKSGKPLTRTALRRHPLPAVIDGDKETKGRILVIAGSREVPGAVLLTATAAMRAGAGKLKIATVESVAVPAGIAMPEAKVVALPEHRRGGFARSAVARIGGLAADTDAIIAGPGILPDGTCAKIADVVMKSDRAIALDAALLHSLPIPKVKRSTLPVLLPHAGELAALLDCDEEEIATDPIACGLRAAKIYRSIVLVKGVTSHVVHPDERAWTYRGGAPGLGVSGSGDVLAGIVGGLLARGAEPLTALLWGVWLHGEAGAALAKRNGPTGFLAREIADQVPALLRRAP